MKLVMRAGSRRDDPTPIRTQNSYRAAGPVYGMSVEPLSVLHTGVFLAIVAGLYGLVVSVVWSPFLISGRVRRLFDALSSRDWRLDYALSAPLPAVCWGFLCGAAVSLSLDVRPPGDASPLYASGVDGIVAATAISLLLWPALLVYVLPARGIDWYASEDRPTTVVLVLAGIAWYLPWLVVPTYYVVVFAGFGDVMTGP